MSTVLRAAFLASAAIHLGAAGALYPPDDRPPARPVMAATLRAALPEGPAIPVPLATPARQDGKAKAAPTQARAVMAATQPRSVPAVAVPAPSPAVSDAVVQEPAARPAPLAPPVAAAPGPALELPRFDAAYLANPPPAYPVSARRRGIEGTVLLEARVGPGGEPREVKLAASAGDAALDEAALQAVRGWRFEPARRGSQTVEAWVRIPLVFRLN